MLLIVYKCSSCCHNSYIDLNYYLAMKKRKTHWIVLLVLLLVLVGFVSGFFMLSLLLGSSSPTGRAVIVFNETVQNIVMYLIE